MPYAAVWELIKKIAPLLLVLGVAAAIWTHGYHTANKDHIVTLANIQAQSDALMDAAVSENKVKEEQALRFNDQLEKSYEQNIATINTYFDRVRASRAASRKNTVPSCDSAGTPETPTTEFAEAAYRIEAYANSCWRFIENECGTKSESSN